MMNSTIWELGNDDNNCNNSWGWTCHWGILGIDQLGSEYQILTLFDLNLSSQAVNGCCICSAPFVCPVCQLSGAFCRAADCGNLFQMLPFLSVYISAKSRVERLSSKPELNNTAAIQCQVLEIWGWEKLSFCLLWWFVCKCRGQVAASQLWFARSQRSVAPESCDVSRTGKEIFCQLLKLAICCNQMCRNWENRNKETLCTASKAELAHTLKSGSMAHIVCWLSPSLRAWSTWVHGHVKGVLTLEGKTHILWVQWACWAAELSKMGSDCLESWQGYVWIKKGDVSMGETEPGLILGAMWLLQVVTGSPLGMACLYTATQGSVCRCWAGSLSPFCSVSSSCRSVNAWPTVTTFLLEVIFGWFLIV